MGTSPSRSASWKCAGRSESTSRTPTTRPSPSRRGPSADGSTMSPDGQRFVMIRGEKEAPTRLHGVLSWLEERRRRAQPA